MNKLLATAAVLATLITSANALVIDEDRGGNLAVRDEKTAALKASGEKVIIRGSCASACTMMVLRLPPQQVCATADAQLGFHAMLQAKKSGSDEPLLIKGKPVIAPSEIQKAYMTGFPEKIKTWLRQNGALTRAEMTRVPATNFIRPCDATELASVPPPINKHVRWCQSSADTPEGAWCLGYLLGVAHSLSALGQDRICMPDNTKMSQFREVVLTYHAQGNEEVKKYTIDDLVLFAAEDKWPCVKPATPVKTTDTKEQVTPSAKVPSSNLLLDVYKR